MRDFQIFVRGVIVTDERSPSAPTDRGESTTSALIDQGRSWRTTCSIVTMSRFQIAVCGIVIADEAQAIGPDRYRGKLTDVTPLV